ncbi:hypothetical protein [Goodfellowiella coeruleoviolacea]|uniref:hypothetical protein n=1 Tax=Goodfellowiella coeruleoviolacea TaxID=334858 RepID=UPI000A800DB5|nr:hypothetical protein [Goodfellowiella coeruleoviolacea]
MAAGISAVVVALAGGTALAQDSASPATGTQAQVLGPNGYGNLQLGMNPMAALATGQLTDYKVGWPECSFAKLKDQPAAPDSIAQNFVAVALDQGVSGISVSDPAVRTPEGIGLGSTVDQVKAAYPDSADQLQEGLDNLGRGYVTVPGSSRPAVYRIHATNNTVDQLALQLTNQNCYE